MFYSLLATAEAKCAPGSGALCDTGLPRVTADNLDKVQILLQITFGVMSAVAVIVILIAAIKFVTAQGNPQDSAKARMAIVYAIIGLVVALAAEAIVTFVLNNA